MLKPKPKPKPPITPIPVTRDAIEASNLAVQVTSILAERVAVKDWDALKQFHVDFSERIYTWLRQRP